MEEIKFRPGFNFDTANEEWLAKRLAMIVLGTDQVTRKETGYQWALGPTNDWWMEYDPVAKEVTLAYRYGGGRNDSHMRTLRTAIIWLLGFEDSNPIFDGGPDMASPDKGLANRLSSI
ncbi:hypothetical protein IPM19_00760 [bacterium]|nr:MAG: hypothetical protein IPM19_00760 [bacterium]